MKKKKLATAVMSMALAAASVVTPVFAQTGANGEQAVVASAERGSLSVSEAEQKVADAKQKVKEYQQLEQERAATIAPYEEAYNAAYVSTTEKCQEIIELSAPVIAEFEKAANEAYEKYLETYSEEDEENYYALQGRVDKMWPFTCGWGQLKDILAVDREGFPEDFMQALEDADLVQDSCDAAFDALWEVQSSLPFSYWEETQNAKVDVIDAMYDLLQARNNAATASVVDVFEDIKGNEWYKDAVQDVYNKGVMTGKNATHFSPLNKLGRAEVVTVLWRISGSPETEYDPYAFPDVKESDWYAEAAMWARENGVATGYNDGTFGGAKSCTREQFVTMLHRFTEGMIGGKGFVPETTTAYVEHFGDADMFWNNKSYENFKDGARVTEFAHDAMGWAVETGIIQGKSNGEKLDPQGTISRAECATILARYTK